MDLGQPAVGGVCGQSGLSLGAARPNSHTPSRISVAQPRGRILGGQEAMAHARPYMASVQVNGTHVCGGTLVDEQWVLSAAHCMDGV